MNFVDDKALAYEIRIEALIKKKKKKIDVKLQDEPPKVP
jgi:hypothetical protein